jgi:uncharacterized protein
MKTLNLHEFYPALQKSDIKPAVILIGSAVLLTLHRYAGSIEFAERTITEISSFYSSLFMFVNAFILMGIIPVLIIKFVFKDSLSNYGISAGNPKAGLIYIVILYPLITLLLLIPSAGTAEMINFYPLDRNAGSSTFSFLRFEVIRLLLFYTAWEFFFRGFMLSGIQKYYGSWSAIFIQTIPSCLWHIGMPSGEISASIPGGILFGIMAVQTRSIIYPLILHFLIGLTLDLLIII